MQSWREIDSQVQAALIAAVSAVLGSLIGALFAMWRTAAETKKLNLEVDRLKRENVRDKTSELRKYVESFLIVLKNNFEETGRVQQSLIGDLADVEFHPLALKMYFSKLETQDARKLTWFKKISFLVKHNKELLYLIDENRHEVETDNFRKNIRAFKDHAQDWEDMWRDFRHVSIPDEKASWDEEAGVMMAHMLPMPEGVSELEQGNWKRAARFPKGMTEALDGEIAATRARIAELAR